MWEPLARDTPTYSAAGHRVPGKRMKLTPPNALRIRSKTGGKRVCRRDCLLHPLVVRRFAPSSKWMTIRSALFRARSVRNNG
jgi:hypothetical protein